MRESSRSTIDETVLVPQLGRARQVRGRFRWSGPRLHHLLFLAFTVVAAVPIALLAIWEGRAAFQNELDSVRERHLLVARNLTSSMSRYVQDAKAVFSMAFESGALAKPVPGVADLLIALHVVHLCTIAPDGRIEMRMDGLPNDLGPRLDPSLMDTIRALAHDAGSEPVVSQLVRNRKGLPALLLVRNLPEGRIGLGVLLTDYLVSLQQAIAFGDNGHAVITDANGQVIAHPFKDWTAASRDISGVPVVAAMMRGEMGVGQFYSPAFKGDMIAGYAVVPETGWGVMVPQPIAELRQRANQVNEMATMIAIASFGGAAILSWLIALYLARPVQVVGATAEAVLSGNDEVRVPPFDGWVPQEIRRLGQAFNTMLEGLRLRAGETRAALRQAEASNRAKTQFLANMSHEIRTPLNGVVGMIELMRLTELSPTQRRYAEQATQSSQSLLRLVDDILDLSRIEVGRLRLERMPFHLSSVANDARTLFHEQARERNLRLDVAVADDLDITVLGDPLRLLQVLTNLINNAIKFTTEGSVTVRISRMPGPSPSVIVRFDVTDTGIGIPPAQQSLIFEAFSQADNSATRRYGGTGLGLSIARELVRMMGGEITVSSAVGAGSTFTFTLTFDVPNEQSPTAGSANSSIPKVATRDPDTTIVPLVPLGIREFQDALHQVGRDAVRVLLVEDNEANLRVTQALLEALGCEVVPSRNGIEAVTRYREGQFDLVLMDCQMPEMDGYAATGAIRRIEADEGRCTPIVALTAHAMEGSREASLASGMNDQLTKPLTMAALMAMLVRWLVRGGAAVSGTKRRSVSRPSTSSQ
jgi:signal transduction histidine kinase/ActR/RegA family two-component response regulator